MALDTKKWILHVGFPKTGTTSIQETLLRNTKLLEEQGIHYSEVLRPPSQNRVNHGEMLVSLFSEQPETLFINYRWREGDIRVVNASYREQFERLLVREDCMVLVSGESLANQSLQLLEKVKNAIQQYNWSIEIIASLNSPLSNITKNYSESVKNGTLDKVIHYIPHKTAFQRLKNLRSVFDTVRTYPFSEACGHPYGPVGYFLDFLGIENVGAFEFVKANQGISNNAVRLLEYVNGFEPLVFDDKLKPERSYSDLKMFWKIPGPKFRLTCEEYEAVREHIEFENAWLESNLGKEYCDDEIELRRSNVHWDEDSLQAVGKALPEVPKPLVPYVHKYFEEVQGIVLTQDTAASELPGYRPALERPEEVVRSVDERLQVGQLNNMSAVALLRSAVGGDEGDLQLYDRACELLLQAGKVREAMRLVDEGLVRFDGDLALMSRLGYAYEVAGETDRALDQWARVRRAHPSAEAGWIDGAMYKASLGFENDACELLFAYLAQRQARLSRPWWNRVLRTTEVILLGYSEGRHVRGLLKSLFFRPVAPDLAAHLALLSLLQGLTIQKRRIRNSRGNYRKGEKIFDLLKEIHRHFPVSSSNEIIALELALGIDIEPQNFDRIREFLARLSFRDFCIIFSLRCLLEVQFNFLLEPSDIHEIIVALPVTDADNAKKCLAMRYALGMDYEAAYKALTGSSLSAAREGYSDFAFAAYAGNGRPKVAFCISGQLRGYRKVFASWRKSRLFTDCDVSVFVHTWPEIGTTALDSYQANRTFSGNFLQAFVKEFSMTEGKLSSEKLDKFEKVYPNLLRVAVESQEVVSAEKLSKFYGTSHVVVESEALYRNYTSQEKMYYKVQKCWELACAGGEEFHFVFRVRPDLALYDDSEVDWREIVARSQNERIAYVKYLIFMEQGLAVEDQLAFGNPAAMAVYSNAWSRVKDPASLAYAHSRKVQSHISFALCLVESEVKALPFPEAFVVTGLVNTKRPSLESLRDALEKDLAPNSRRQNPMWRALEEDMSYKS